MTKCEAYANCWIADYVNHPKDMVECFMCENWDWTKNICELGLKMRKL